MGHSISTLVAACVTYKPEVGSSKVTLPKVKQNPTEPDHMIVTLGEAFLLPWTYEEAYGDILFFSGVFLVNSERHAKKVWGTYLGLDCHLVLK